MYVCVCKNVSSLCRCIKIQHLYVCVCACGLVPLLYNETYKIQTNNDRKGKRLNR